MILELALLLSYTFTPSQQADITSLHSAGPFDDYMPGNHAPMYQYITNALASGNPPPSADPEVNRSRL